MRPRFAKSVRLRFWAALKSGLSLEEAAVSVGVSPTAALGWFQEAGGVAPVDSSSCPASYRRLSAQERENIALWRAEKIGGREIARRLGRSPGTISKELARNAGYGGRYKASTAQVKAEQRARRPKPARLATSLPLRAEVQARLKRNDSPQQIAGRLRRDFPDEPEMWVSHETIYQALYVQSRGALTRELVQHLRTGRVRRRPVLPAR